MACPLPQDAGPGEGLEETEAGAETAGCDKPVTRVGFESGLRPAGLRAGIWGLQAEGDGGVPCKGWEVGPGWLRVWLG